MSLLLATATSLRSRARGLPAARGSQHWTLMPAERPSLYCVENALLQLLEGLVLLTYALLIAEDAILQLSP